MGEQRRHLGVLVAVAVEEARAIRRRPPRGRGTRCAAGPPRSSPRRHAVHGGPVGQDRIEVRLGLGDPDVADAAPQPGRAVEGAHDDRDDEHDQPGAEPRRAEDGEDRQPIERVDHAGAEQRVVARVEVLERGRVVGRRAEGEVGHLRMVMPMTASTARKMIWRTAKSTDVNSRHIPYPIRAGTFRPDGREVAQATSVLAMARGP